MGFKVSKNLFRMVGAQTLRIWTIPDKPPAFISFGVKIKRINQAVEWADRVDAAFFFLIVEKYAVLIFAGLQRVIRACFFIKVFFAAELFNSLNLFRIYRNRNKALNRAAPSGRTMCLTDAGCDQRLFFVHHKIEYLASMLKILLNYYYTQVLR